MAVNFGFLHFMPPPTGALRLYARHLYDRRGEGVLVPRQEIEVPGWQPDPKHCHDNTVRLEAMGIGYKAVHGWLYLDFGGALAYVRFVAHSVVADANGNLIDITPLIRQAGAYPFISSNLLEDEFAGVIAELEEAHSVTNLDHVLLPAA